MTVTRLPVQHPKKPHCLHCKRDLPDLRGFNLLGSAAELDGLTLEGLTFNMRCTCGKLIDMRKDIQAIKGV